MTDAAAGRVELARDSAPHGDAFVPYKIVVDGEAQGEIRTGETRVLSLPAGNHRMELRCMRFWRSRLWFFEVRAGETTKLRCRPSSISQTVRFFFVKDYIALAPDEASNRE